MPPHQVKEVSQTLVVERLNGVAIGGINTSAAPFLGDMVVACDPAAYEFSPVQGWPEPLEFPKQAVAQPRFVWELDRVRPDPGVFGDQSILLGHELIDRKTVRLSGGPHKVYSASGNRSAMFVARPERISYAPRTPPDTFGL
jgi:hypothetical protein